MKAEHLVIFTDGASRGNPGAAAIGAIIKDEEDRAVAVISQRIGRATNNQAEYRAIITALDKALRLGARRVTLNSDSELAIKQIKGEYRVKVVGLKPLHQQVKALQSRFSGFTIKYIPGEHNTEAHNLAQRALDNA